MKPRKPKKLTAVPDAPNIDPSPIPPTANPSPKQLELAVSQGHLFADHLLDGAMNNADGEPSHPNIQNLNMHKLKVAAECIWAVALANEVHYGGASLEDKVFEFTGSLKKMIQIQISHYKRTDAGHENNS